MRNKYLLGSNKYNELVFGEFEIREWNGKSTFSASFSTVRPFNGTDFDLEEYYENYLWGMDKSYLYDLCESYDCRPSELVEKMADDCYDLREALDCSLYPETYSISGKDWHFESGSCGQHDTREEGMEIIINPVAYNLLHELWDNYHLKEVDEEIISKVEELKEMLSEVDEEEWIVNYIQTHEELF